MSDELVLSGAGSTAVASDELHVHADSLGRFSVETAVLCSQLWDLDRLVSTSSLRLADAPLSSAAAEDHIDKARMLLESMTDEARLMSNGLIRAAERYGETERSNEALFQFLSGRFANLLGVFGPLLLMVLGPMVLLVAGGAMFGRHVYPEAWKRQTGDLSDWLKDNNELLTNPATVALVRSLVMSSDDFFAGWAGVPADLAALLGDQGIGLTGPDTSAATLLMLGGAAGLLGESPVRVIQTGAAVTTRPPQGFGERIERIPDASAREDGAQIRVERYSMPGQEDRFEVYIAGTADAGLQSADEPWDMTSNVHAMAGLPPGSLVAVAEAMADAGVTEQSPVVFNGYSQGGLVATMLAGSGEYNTHGLVTVGSPSGQVALPGTFPVIAIEHTDDLVPAIGGTRIDSNTLVVERHLYGGREVENDFAVPAHQLDQYQETAGLLDQAKSDAVRNPAREFSEFTAGATGVETTWRAERIAG